MPDVAPVTSARLLGLPGFVENRYFDVLAANSAARALDPNLVAGRNRVLDLFLDPAEQALYPDLDVTFATLVRHLRHALGAEPDDPHGRGTELIERLTSLSAPFAEMWARHDVRDHDDAVLELTHPSLGALALRRQRLAVAGRDGQFLIVLYAAPDSSSADALAGLSHGRPA